MGSSPSYANCAGQVRKTCKEHPVSDLMIEFLLHPVVVIPTVVLMFLPWNWHLRVGVWGLILAVLAIILGTPGTTGGFAAAIFGLVLVVLFLCWCVAGLLQLFLRRMINGAWPEFRHLRSDWLITWAGHALLALCLFLFVAFRMGETRHVIMLHGALFTVALLCFREPGFAISLAVLTGFSLYHPRIVITAADAAAGGQAHCIYLNQRDSVASGWKDLTFLTMDKGNFTPHAYVIPRTAPSAYGSWSYRQRAFNPPQHLHSPLPDNITCPTD